MGGGLTDIETATEMVGKLRTAMASAPGHQSTESPRVILADRQPWIGSDMDESARPVIEEALQALGIETRVGVSVPPSTSKGPR